MESKKIPLITLIQEGEACLKAAGIEAPRREAALLITVALKCSLAEIFMMDRQTSIDPDLVRLLFKRRALHEPFAYIAGEQGFWSLDLTVSSATLIPRADSESLIEGLLSLYPQRNLPYHILDLGTGTGCLLLAALSEYKSAYGIGIDLIPQAVDLAVHNAKQCGLSDRVSFLVGNWADALQGKFDIILSNPPYICRNELMDLMPEVIDYEPLSALDGGETGLEAYLYICQQIPYLLNEKGVAILELGIHQEKQVETIAKRCGLSVVQRQQDLGGCIRALVLSHNLL